MPDPIFENPRLVEVYDSFDGQRRDLEHYLALVKELKANSILDVGCGTGCFPCLLADQGCEVYGLEPAAASLDFARRKANAAKVQWILGDTSALPPLQVDLAVMTGNVAQVFLSDQAWLQNLTNIRRALNPKGHLVFESRKPSQKAWLEWNRKNTQSEMEIAGVGKVTSWCDLLDVSKDLVSFRWSYLFESDGALIASDSTLRFRDQTDITDSLLKSGYRIREIREAPDRPGKEFVFIACCD